MNVPILAKTYFLIKLCRYITDLFIDRIIFGTVPASLKESVHLDMKNSVLEVKERGKNQ